MSNGLEDKNSVYTRKHWAKESKLLLSNGTLLKICKTMYLQDKPIHKSSSSFRNHQDASCFQIHNAFKSFYSAKFIRTCKIIYFMNTSSNSDLVY